MINVSNAFKRELYEGHRDYLEMVDITLTNGRELRLTNEHLWQGGLTIEDAVSSDSTFDIGAAIINQCTVVINNINDEFSPYDFTGAKVVAYVGLLLPDGRAEMVRKGTYAVDEAKYNGSIITLTCLDNMRKFDKAYSLSTLQYPATLGQIVRDACGNRHVDVALNTPIPPHDDFIINERPNGDSTTFRSVISWAAQIAGCFCRCDELGRLELKWYPQDALEEAGLDGGKFDAGSPAYTSGSNADGGTFRPWNDGDTYDGGDFASLKMVHHIGSNYSIDISVDDVVITGVRVLEKTKEDNKDAIVTYQAGTDGYVVSIEGNELIQGGAGKEIAGWLGEQLIGLRFRRANVTHPSDPSMEAGDVGFLTDRKGNTYGIVFSSTRFSTGAAQTTVSAAENPARNSADRFSAETRNYVERRKDIEKERTDREVALAGLKDMMDHASGLFMTKPTTPSSGKILYMHDKPTLAESKIVWKMTELGWAVSTDGGKTYNAGVDMDGDMIARILTADGVNANWIKTGTISADLIKSGILDGIVVKSTWQNEYIKPPRNEEVRIEQGRLYIYAESYAGKDLRPVGVIEPYYTKSLDSSGNLSQHYIEGIRISARNQYIPGNSIGNTVDIGGVIRVKEVPSVGEKNGSVFVTCKYFDITDGSGSLDGDSTVRVLGSLFAYGTKNRVATTPNYGERLLYCYEMPSPMFGDIGEGVTDEQGECYIYFDDVFAETVAANIEYQVFLQPEGRGFVWVEEKTPTHFKVVGDANLKFAWEVKAKQGGYEYERLESTVKYGTNATNYERLYEDEINGLIKEQEEILHETT